jgi:hypothetical protein
LPFELLLPKRAIFDCILNKDLHRGCSYGMDLGPIQIENGCFVEEDGATFCFCDFNRCNAAGILDLRNLIDDKNGTEAQTIRPFYETDPYLEKSLLREEENTRITKYQSTQPAKNSHKKNFSSSSLSTKASSSHSSTPKKNTSSFNPTNGIFENHILNNTFLNFSGAYSKKINNQQLLNKLDMLRTHAFKQQTEIPKDSQLPKNKTETKSTNMQVANSTRKTTFLTSKSSIKLKDKSSLRRRTTTLKSKFIASTRFSTLDTAKVNFNKKTTPRLQIRKESERSKTASKVYPNTNENIQEAKFFKTNIDDKFSKDLLGDVEFRSRLGLKADEKLNILLFKQSLENEESQLNEKLWLDVRRLYNNNKPTINQKITTNLPSTTLSWLEKLKAKLSSSGIDIDNFNGNNLNQINSLNANRNKNAENGAELYDWSYVLSRNYKQGLKYVLLFFKFFKFYLVNF